MNGTDATTVIRIEGLHKSFDHLEVLKGIDLTVAEHEVICLIGASGSGKSTLLRCVNLLEPVDAGRVIVHGEEITAPGVDVNRIRRSMGIVFQSFNLFPHMTVLKNITLAPRKALKLSETEAEARATDLLERFGLADKRAQPVATLSGGMRRALDIVRGVLHEPRVLFLDEPTTGLDLPNRRRIWRFIERLRARTGMTLLLTTHYLEEADGCDRVAFIRKGRLVESGAPRLLVERLGRHMLEVEGPDLDGLVGMLEPRLGTCLRDGDVAYFRSPDEDIAAIARLQAELGSKVSAWRVRRPNLNDVFLWIADGKALS